MTYNTTHEFDYVEKVKVGVRDLVPGMYVSELDRHLQDSPFLFQGFELKSIEDVEEVKKVSKFVFIDLLRTRIEHVNLHGPSSSFKALRADCPFCRHGR